MSLFVRLTLVEIFALSFPMRLAVCLVVTPFIEMGLFMQVENGTIMLMKMQRGYVMVNQM